MAKKKKHKKNKKTAIERKRRPLFRLDLLEETKRKIYGVLMFFGAVIVSLSFFNLFGKAGRVFMELSDLLIGKALFLLPLLFVLGGIVFFKQKYEPEMKTKKNKLAIFFGIIILIISVSGVFGILSLDEEVKQGGWLGYLTSVPLVKAFGVLGTTIIFIAVIIIGGLILWQISPRLIKKEKEILEKEKEPSFAKAPEGEGEKSIINSILKKKESKPELVQEKFEVSMPERERKNSSIFKLETKSFAAFPGEIYQPPPLNLLAKDEGSPTSGDTKVNSAIIKRTLQNFDVAVEMSEVNIGPTVTQYTFKPAEGVKLSKITALNSDLSLALAAHPIRIEAPIPGRSLVGIELPNRGRARVGLRNLLEQPEFQDFSSKLIFTLGRDVAGNPVFADLGKMPHLLVAGSTGSGKTICLNNIIISLLYHNSPESLRFILVDPKRVEFSVYNGLPHFLSPVILTPQKTVNVLKWLITEMERRFDLLSEIKARDITGYNEIIARNSRSQAQDSKPEEKILEPLPYIVLIIDELADVMAARGRDVEAGIVRLAQMSRAVGIHLIVATQRPSVEVITGLIKANITSRIAFQVASQVDSRTILDMAGAEKLLGAGDMLFISAEIVKPRRIQNAYISEKEIRKVSNWLKKSEAPSSDDLEEKEKVEKEISEGSSKISETNLVSPLEEVLEKEESFYTEDPLYEEAKRIVIESKKASASLLQRRLRLGYARAARLVDTLEERGVVGPAEGAKPREVYIRENDQISNPNDQ
ncbi:DNA translocase FtsK [Candidatus Parcubacteria bacterium]|nr:DNA translocase FtsK [Candidatus Parcubacteria bacterium]